ncbi:MAG: photosynthetic protein synthase II [Cryomorphaceae bacterium BACL21 MAG-121220-bin10]|jgi:protein SCO1|nr:MAG: photosynthetic protein synthase II [Cryomorphaceae bacterium BACL21 MAG-121220-bin10]
MKKQNYSYVGISFVILVFGILFVPKIVNRITGNYIVDKDRHQLDHGTQITEDLAVIGPAPYFALMNQHGDTITAQDMRGKVYVLEFFFTTCPSICPIMSQNLLQVQDAFYDHQDVGVISISINPDYDRPEVLLAYAQQYGMTHPNWHLLTGNSKTISALANSGFNLYVGPGSEVDGGFEHSGFFALVDGDGQIRSRRDNFDNPIIYYDGLEQKQIEKLIFDIQTLLEDKS